MTTSPKEKIIAYLQKIKPKTNLKKLHKPKEEKESQAKKYAQITPSILMSRSKCTRSFTKQYLPASNRTRSNRTNTVSYRN